MASGQAVPTETLRDRRVNQPDYLESVIALDQVTGATMDGFVECMRLKAGLRPSQIPTFFENQPCFDSIEV